jgi:hypothetical protein
VQTQRKLIAIVSCLLLVACSGMPSSRVGAAAVRSNDQVCKGNGYGAITVCQIDVNCGGNGCFVDPDVMLIEKGTRGQEIMFSLKGTHFEFPVGDPNGLALEFPQNSGWVCQWNKNNGKCRADSYVPSQISKYTVKVVDPAGHDVTIDPWVVNN